MYGTLEWHWHSVEDFSIPFTVTSGEAVYLGDFRGIATTRRSALSLGAPLPTGVYFVVSNREQRDFPIARRKAPYLADIKVQVTDPAAIRSRYFMASCRPEECD
jgi:hypothetical protein